MDSLDYNLHEILEEAQSVIDYDEIKLKARNKAIGEIKKAFYTAFIQELEATATEPIPQEVVDVAKKVSGLGDE